MMMIWQNCKVGALCRIGADEIIPDNTVIYGEGLRRLDVNRSELTAKAAARQVDVLKKLVSGNAAKWQ